MAGQQFFGALLAGAAVLIGYLAYKGRLQMVWTAITGGSTQPQSATSAAASGAALGASAGLKYVASIG